MKNARVIIVLFIAVVAAFAAGFFLATKNPFLHKITQEFLGGEVKFKNGVKLDTPDGWRLVPGGASEQKFVIMKSTATSSLRMLTVCSIGASDLGLAQEDMALEKQKIAVRLWKHELKYYTDMQPKDADKYNSYKPYSFNVVNVGNRNWAEADLQYTKDTGAFWWKFVYTIYKNYIIYMDYEYMESGEIHLKVAQSQDESVIKNLITGIQFSK